MAPKLKEKHMELPPFQAMHVNLTAQVLSHSVAARISTLVTLKYLPEEAVKTSTFVDHFDALFNTFNSKSLKSTQQMGHSFQQSSSHHAFLRRACMFSAKSKHLMGMSFLALLNGKFVSMLFFNCGNTCQRKLDLNSSSQIASIKIAWKTSSVLSATKGVQRQSRL